MVRLSDSPGDSVLTAAKESAESEGRARNLAILHCTEAFSLALRLFIFVIGGISCVARRLARSAQCPLQYDRLQRLPVHHLRGEITGCSEQSRSLKQDMVPLVTVDSWD